MKSTTYQNQESVKRRATRMINSWNIETISQSKGTEIVKSRGEWFIDIVFINMRVFYVENNDFLYSMFSEHRIKENTFTLNKSN